MKLCLCLNRVGYSQNLKKISGKFKGHSLQMGYDLVRNENSSLYWLSQTKKNQSGEVESKRVELDSDQKLRYYETSLELFKYKEDTYKKCFIDFLEIAQEGKSIENTLVKVQAQTKDYKRKCQDQEKQLRRAKERQEQVEKDRGKLKAQLSSLQAKLKQLQGQFSGSHQKAVQIEENNKKLLLVNKDLEAKLEKIQKNKISRDSCYIVPLYDQIFRTSFLLKKQRSRTKILVSFLENFNQKQITSTNLLYNWPNGDQQALSDFFKDSQASFVVLFALKEKDCHRFMGFFSTGILNATSTHNPQAFLFSLEDHGYFFPKNASSTFPFATRLINGSLVLGNKELELKTDKFESRFWLRSEVERQYFHMVNPKALVGNQCLSAEDPIDFEMMEIHRISF